MLITKLCLVNEGKGKALMSFEVLSQKFRGGAEENYGKPQSQRRTLESGFEPGTSHIRR